MANTRSVNLVLPEKSSLWQNYSEPDSIADLNKGITVKTGNVVADANGNKWIEVTIPEKFYVSFLEQYNNPTEND